MKGTLINFVNEKDKNQGKSLSIFGTAFWKKEVAKCYFYKGPSA